MKRHRIFPFILFMLTVFQSAAQNDTTFVQSSIVLPTTTGDIHGTLTFPKNESEVPVALIIAGSGPTDRDGNNPMMVNDGLKKLSISLAANNIASVRFDKRGIVESKGAGISESDLRFEDYVNDVKEWIELLKKDSRFTKVALIGHSEGSLIGMLAAENADLFISLAGPGQSADKIIKQQLSTQPMSVQQMTYPIIDSLKSGHTVNNVSPMLYTLFRPSVQPYLISWFKYSPAEEVKKLSVPVLIIQGTNDLQVTVDDARLLAKARPAAKIVAIDNMNHVFRIRTGDRQENIASYNKKDLPISQGMITAISYFINEN